MPPNNLTIYLFTKEATSFRASVRPIDPDEGRFSWLEPAMSPGFRCELATLIRSPQPPEWSSYFRDYFPEINNEWPRNQAASAILFAEISGRIFALTFGNGYTMLRTELLVLDFGLRVTGNRISPESVKGVGSNTLRHNSRRTDQSLARPDNLDNFDPNIHNELVTKLAGRPDSETRKNIEGKVALKIPVSREQADIRHLPSILSQALTDYSSNRYQESFPMIGNFKQLDPRSKLVAELDTSLTHRLQQGIHTLLGCAVPQTHFRDAEDRAATFHIHGDRHGKKPRAELTLNWIKDRMLEAGSKPLSKLKVQLAAADGEIIGDRPLRDFLTAELSLYGERYVLTDGRWVQVDRNHYQEIIRKLGNIKFIRNGLGLPHWEIGKHERAYNEFAAKGAAFALLDRVPYKSEHAKSSVEIADLLAPDLSLICVKRLDRSTQMSHLLKQGSTTAALYCSDEDFRAAVARHYRRKWPHSSVPQRRPTLVYAIGTSKPADNLYELLPFLTQESLTQEVDGIARLPQPPTVIVTTIPMRRSPSALVSEPHEQRSRSRLITPHTGTPRRGWRSAVSPDQQQLPLEP